jgi:hypothetical protein
MHLGIKIAIDGRSHELLCYLCKQLRQNAPNEIASSLNFYLEAVFNSRSGSMMSALLDNLQIDVKMSFPCLCPDCKKESYSLASHASALDIGHSTWPGRDSRR